MTRWGRIKNSTWLSRGSESHLPWTRSSRRHHDPAGFGRCPEEAGRKLASSPAGPGSLGSSQQRGSGSPPVPPGAMGRETLSQLQSCIEVIRCGRWTPRRQLLGTWKLVWEGPRTRYSLLVELSPLPHARPIDADTDMRDAPQTVRDCCRPLRGTPSPLRLSLHSIDGKGNYLIAEERTTAASHPRHLLGSWKRGRERGRKRQVAG